MLLRPPHRLKCLVHLLLLLYLPYSSQDNSTDVTPTTTTDANITINKDDREPSTRIVVRLNPIREKYSQYIAKVVDMSEEHVRDSVRTFLASGTNAALINIHNLHPGHHYKVMLVGRRDNVTTVVQEQDVLMDPQAPNFSQHGATITASETNITLTANLAEKALQDSFIINYRQVSPDEAYPPMELSNVEGQTTLELFLNRLRPGHDYEVSVVAVKDGVRSQAWNSTVTTKPSKIISMTAIDALPNCVNLTWTLPPTSGVDHFEVAYGPVGGDILKESAASSTRSFTACDGLSPGFAALFSITVVKSSVASSPVTVEHIMRPRPPTTFNIRPDTWSSKYRIWADIATEGRIDGCALSVVSETLERVDTSARVEGNETTCEFLLPLKPGDRYELSVQTTSLNTKSNKVQRSLALPPAFDMTSFGLSVQEARGGLEIAWPASELFIEKLKELWAKVVGAESVLHARLSQTGSNETARQFETSPYTRKPIFISNLTQGACYKVQLYTVTKSGIVSDNRFDESMRISPPPLDISLHSVSRTIASLRLSLMSGANSTQPECQSLLVVTDEHGLAVFDKHLPLPTPLADVPLDGLRPFHKYTVATQVLCGSSTSSCPAASRTMRSLTFVTRQDRPGPVQSPTVASINSFSAQLAWQPPSLPNGIVTHYVISIQPESGEQWSVNVGAGTGKETIMEAVVDGLRGGMTYSFLIRAVTEAGMGDPPAVSDAPRLTMPIHAPPRPSSSPSVLDQSITSRSLTLNLPPSLFDTRNGPIVRFAVLVSEVTSDLVEESTNSSYTWSEVQPLHRWPTYTTLVLETGGHTPPPTTVEIGTSDNCLSLPLHFVCNGPLRPSTQFRFALRLFTTPALFTDTPASVVITTGSEGTPATAWIVLISISLLFTVLLGLVCVVLCNNTGKQDKRPLDDSPSSSLKESQWRALRMIMTERATECLARLGLDNGIDHPVGSSDNNNHPEQLNIPQGVHPRSPIGKVNGMGGATPRRTGSLRERTGVDHKLDNLPGLPGRPLPHTIVAGSDVKRSRPVPIDRFVEHVKIMSADSDFRFAEEYELFRNVGLGASTNAAELALNRAKNRFTNILPFDHSRVKLRARDDDENGEDYINANYIPGVFSRREFIAAQGPLPSTRDDFWRMIMEQQVPVIVALTKCIEKGRDKCHQYWPDKERMSLLYGDIEVTLLSETETHDMVIRELRLTPLSAPQTARTITHMHYMAWPDFGVPESPQGIVKLVRLFRQKLPRNPNNKPVVVHCSAGVGRSGTFMGIDRLMYMASMGRPLDVFGTVHEMRQERCSMVQNESQYIFIHHALLYCLLESPEGHETPPPSGLPNDAYDDDEGIAESGL